MVGDGHDDADGDIENRGDGEGEENTVPREVHGIVFYHKNGDHEHDDECEEVPGHRCIGVAAHEATVDIFSAGDDVFVACCAQVLGFARRIGICCVGDRLVPSLGLVVMVAFEIGHLGLLPHIVAMPAGCVGNE